MFRFNTLDRYLLREIAVPFAIGMGLFFVIVAFGQVLKMSDSGTGLGITGTEVLQALLYSLPPLMGLLIPVSSLFATLLGVGRVAADREVTIICALGGSPYRLLKVPAIIGTLLAIVCAFALIKGEPWGMRGLRDLLSNSAQRAIAQGVEPGEFTQWLPGITFMAQGKDGEKLTDLIFADRRNHERPLLISAKRGTINGGKAAKDIFLDMEDGSILMRNQTSKDYRLIHFKSSQYRLNVRKLVTGSIRSVSRLQQFTIAELRRKLARSRHKKTRARVAVTLQRKFALPLATLIFALLAVPLACASKSGARARGFLYSSAMVGLYYYVGRTFELWSRGGEFNPSLAPWVPNILGVAALFFLLWRFRRTAA